LPLLGIDPAKWGGIFLGTDRNGTMTVAHTISRGEVDAAERARFERSDALAALVELDPEQPVADQARLVDSGVAVWAIVNHVGNLAGEEIAGNVDAMTIARTAYDYDIPAVDVVAALDFYQRHRAEVDAWQRRALTLHETIAAQGRPVTA
jgi:uncharacterized protein (DUF433 family)